MHTINNGHRIGWVGVGRMGRPLVTRLLEAGCDVVVYNRTREKAQPLEDLGARIVDAPRGLADRDIVFSVVSGPDDFTSVMLGQGREIWQEMGGPQALIELGVVDAKRMEEAANRMFSSGRVRAANRIWNILNLESWVRPRI